MAASTISSSRGVSLSTAWSPTVTFAAARAIANACCGSPSSATLAGMKIDGGDVSSTAIPRPRARCT